MSRGVPIGPHAVHLIAEATLIPVDNSLDARDITFLRYADDILIFSKNESQAKQYLGRLAQILDQQQRLIVQRAKTRIFHWHQFTRHCNSMIEDRPINPAEDRVLKVVSRYAKGDPYRTISFNEIAQSD